MKFFQNSHKRSFFFLTFKTKHPKDRNSISGLSQDKKETKYLIYRIFTNDKCTYIENTTMLWDDFLYVVRTDFDNPIRLSNIHI